MTLSALLQDITLKESLRGDTTNNTEFLVTFTTGIHVLCLSRLCWNDAILASLKHTVRMTIACVGVGLVLVYIFTPSYISRSICLIFPILPDSSYNQC